MKTVIRLACVLSIASLAACGGGSDGVVNGGDFQSPNVTFDTLASSGTKLATDVSRLDATAIRNMPTTGSARFTGVGAYSASERTIEGVLDNPDTLSRVAIDANFAKSTVSGRAYDFRSADGGPVSGELSISNGQIADNTFTADVGGRLNNRGVPVTYSGEMEGAFAGKNASSLAAIGRATGRASGYANQTVTAVMVAKQ